MTNGNSRSVSRRQFLTATSIGVSALTGCMSGGGNNEGTQTTQSPESNGNWTMYRGGPGQAAYSPKEGPGPNASREWTWQSPATVTEFINNFGYNQIIVTDDTAYVGTKTPYVNETNSRVRLYALDVETGDRKWFYEQDWGEPMAGSSFSTPVVVDGKVILHVSRPGEWKCVGIDSSGEEVWTTTLEDHTSPKNAPIALNDGTVLIKSRPYYRSISPSNGEFGETRMISEESLSFHGDQCFGHYSKTLQRRSLQSEDTEWKFNWQTKYEPEPFALLPIHSNGTVYFVAGTIEPPSEKGSDIPETYHPRLFAVDAETGEENWTRNIEPKLVKQSNDEGEEFWKLSRLFNDIAVSPDTVYASTTPGDVYAMSPADGNERWRESVTESDSLDAYRGGIVASPDGVYITMENSLVYVSADGNSRTLATGDYENATVSLADGRLYVARKKQVEVYT